MKTLEWTTILGGVIAAIIAAFILDWLNRGGTSRVAAGAAQNAWRNTLIQPDPPWFASGQSIGGLNCNVGLYQAPPFIAACGPAFDGGPISASAYGTGAPTATYRPCLRIGTVLVQSQ